ncbi:MAG: hypothetical protein U0872_11440 [Planctomycetaceae bacterium]
MKLIDSWAFPSRVIGESVDDVLGLLYAKDLLAGKLNRADRGTDPVLRELLREPLYVPVTTQIPALLNCSAAKVHLAMVLDEYGGVAAP